MSKFDDVAKRKSKLMGFVGFRDSRCATSFPSTEEPLEDCASGHITEQRTMKLTLLVAATFTPAAVVALQQSGGQPKDLRPVPFGGNRHWASGGAGQKVVSKAESPPPALTPSEGSIKRIDANTNYFQAPSFGGNRPWASGGAGVGSSKGIAGQPTYSASYAPGNGSSTGSFGGNRPWASGGAGVGSSKGIEGEPTYSASNDPGFASSTGSFGGNRPWASGGAGIRSSRGIVGKPTYSASTDDSARNGMY